MPKKSSQIEVIEGYALENLSAKWFAIADSAQKSALPKALSHAQYDKRCLFPGKNNSPVANLAPHLVELGSPLDHGKAWSWISRYAASAPCVSIMSANVEFDTLYRNFVGVMDVAMPDDDEMWLAFWDPAILGALIGQRDDKTLHVKGPILNGAQIHALLKDVNRWWYWDRNGEIHEIAPSLKTSEISCDRIYFTQHQVDELVETSVPDHICCYLEMNQRDLFHDVPSVERYEFVKIALHRARALGLCGMRDIVNYICIELIYKQRLSGDEVIREILSRVRCKKISLDDAIGEFP